MTQRHDEPSRSRRLTEDSMPAKRGSFRGLAQRVDDMEKRLSMLEGRAHNHCSGCGGESVVSNGNPRYRHDADCPQWT